MGARKKNGDDQRAPRYDFKAATPEARAEFDRRIAEGMEAARALQGVSMWPNTVTEDWAMLNKAVAEAMEATIPVAQKKPKRVWIGAETMEMLEHRKAFIEAGMVTEAQDMDKLIKKSAREDKEQWIKARLEDKFWDPIKEVTRKMNPQAVALKRKRGGEGRGYPAEVFA